MIINGVDSEGKVNMSPVDGQIAGDMVLQDFGQVIRTTQRLAIYAHDTIIHPFYDMLEIV